MSGSDKRRGELLDRVLRIAAFLGSRRAPFGPTEFARELGICRRTGLRWLHELAGNGWAVCLYPGSAGRSSVWRSRLRGGIELER